MSMELTISAKGVVRRNNLAEGVSAPISNEEFLNRLSSVAPFTTGWLPPILRYHSEFGGYSQTCLVIPPGKDLVWWGDKENDPNAQRYLLAFPYRVILFDFHNNLFFGARMFYSPVDILSPDQPLYNANVPNINCRGYRGNGVGWLCLYHTDDTKTFNLQERIDYVMFRCLGGEAYNNNNMRETDGTRYYAKHGAPRFLTDPRLWEQKTEREGVEWTLDPELWLPVKVSSPNKQDRNTEDRSGVHLTISMALEGMYGAYYSDRSDELNLAQKARRGLLEDGEYANVMIKTFADDCKRHVRLLNEDIPTEKPRVCHLCDRNIRTDRGVCYKCIKTQFKCGNCGDYDLEHTDMYNLSFCIPCSE